MSAESNLYILLQLVGYCYYLWAAAWRLSLISLWNRILGRDTVLFCSSSAVLHCKPERLLVGDQVI